MPFGIVPFSRDGVAALKHALRDEQPAIRSSHLDEAIAYGLGFDTYAAMLPLMERAEATGCMTAHIDPGWVLTRLLELGYEPKQVGLLQPLLWNPPLKERPELAARSAAAKTWFTPTPANDT